MPYFARRLLALIPILLAITFLSFSLLSLVPGDPALVMLGQDAPKETVEALREALGLNRPFLLRYLWYLGNLLQGDLGTSLYYKTKVVDMILYRIPTTMTLTLLSMVVAVAAGVPSGVVSAIRRNTLVDHVVRVLSLVVFSVPQFWAGLLLMLFFSVRLDLFPITGFVPLQQDLGKSLIYFVLPTLAMGLNRAGFLARLTRSVMLDVLKQDYVRTARSKGLAERKVIYKHALRSALLPLITVVGLDFGVLLGGTVVIESLFGLPGVGQLMVFGILQRDFPVVQGGIPYIALMYALINLVTDLSYSYLDPRVRYS